MKAGIQMLGIIHLFVDQIKYKKSFSYEFSSFSRDDMEMMLNRIIPEVS